MYCVFMKVSCEENNNQHYLKSYKLCHSQIYEDVLYNQ